MGLDPGKMPSGFAGRRFPFFSSRRFRVLLCIVFLSVFYAPVWLWLAGSWWVDPVYSFGFLAIPIAGYMVWAESRRGQGSRPGSGYSWIGGVSLMGVAEALFGFSVLLNVYGLVVGFPLVSGFSLILCVFSLLLLGLGRPVSRFFFPLLVLFLAIPFPFVEGLSVSLASASASVSVWAANLLGVDCVVTGSQISMGVEPPGRALGVGIEGEGSVSGAGLDGCVFVVGLPCSGVRGIFSLLFVSVLLAYLVVLGALGKAVLCASSIPLGFFANSGRILSVLLVARGGGQAAALGWFHGVSSPLFFLASLGGLLLVARIMGPLSFKPILGPGKEGGV